MTKTTAPDCAVMCNLINTHTCIHTSIIDLPLGGSMREWFNDWGGRGYNDSVPGVVND